MENTELAIMVIALLLSTANIYVYAWFDSREAYLNTGIWVLRLTAVAPAAVVLIWAIYLMATQRSSPLALALLAAGMLLVASAIQLLTLLIRKQWRTDAERHSQ